MNTLRSIFPLLALCLLQPILRAEVILVDDDGPADFSSISEAVDMAQNGDMIIVRPGSYSPVFIDNKGLRIVASSPLEAVIDGGVFVYTQSNRVVLLSGLFVYGEPALHVSGGGGQVRVHGCELRSFAGDRALSAVDAPGLVFTDTLLLGGSADGWFDGGNAASIISSQVAYARSGAGRETTTSASSKRAPEGTGSTLATRSSSSQEPP